MKTSIDWTKYMTTDEAAEVLEVHVSTVRRWMKSGLLKRWIYRNQSERLLERREVDELLSRMRSPALQSTA